MTLGADEVRVEWPHNFSDFLKMFVGTKVTAQEWFGLCLMLALIAALAVLVRRCASSFITATLSSPPCPCVHGIVS